MGSNGSSVFKDFCSTIKMTSMCVTSLASLGPGWWSTPWFSFQSFSYFVWGQTHACTVGIPLLCSLLSTLSSTLSGSLRPLFTVPSQKSGVVSQLCYALLMTASVSGAKHQEDRGWEAREWQRGKQQRFAHALEVTALLVREYFPSQNFRHLAGKTGYPYA